MKVLLPTPGTPVMPRRTDLPVCGKIFSMICFAKAWCSSFVDSTKVIARDKTEMSLFKTPSTYSFMLRDAAIFMLIRYQIEQGQQIPGYVFLHPLQLILVIF